MNKISKSQEQAIVHLAGPAQLIAGPGSGKTFTIIQRILYLIQHHHIKPDQILVITYTKAAAKEMKERYEREQAADCKGNVHFGTFHSLCYSVLRQSGFPCSLIREQDRRKLLQTILGNRGLSEKGTYDGITHLWNRISRLKNMPEKDWEADGASDTVFSYGELLQIKEEYDRYLREQGMVDFEDMTGECLRLLKSSEALLGRYRRKFPYILVDEFQDINGVQYEILKLLAHPFYHLMAVGDDDQAIYGFRGASPGIMKQFAEDFKEGKQIWLTENYRSGSEIVNLAKQMISRNENRFEKEFYTVKKGGRVVSACFDTRREEERQLISLLSALDTVQAVQTAVILRTNREVIQYAELFQNAGIVLQGRYGAKTDALHSFIIEDMKAFLAFLYEGKKRKDFICFMNKPNRFLARAALPSSSVKEWELENYYAKNPPMISEIRQLFRQLSMAQGLSPFLSLSLFRKTLGYDRYLKEKAKDHREYEMLMRQSDRVQNWFKDYHGQTSVREFADSWIQQREEEEPQAENTGIHILTMHGAKGLEFDRVFLPDVNEGIIPGKECITKEALEEERRLLYVAITRARNELYLYYTKERGRKLSPFLKGLIPDP